MNFDHLKIAFRYGTLAGAFTILLFVTVWLFKTELFFDLRLVWGSIFIYLLFMYLAASRFNEVQQGLRPYQEVLRDTFGVFVVANAMYWLFHFVLVSYIDPDLVDLQNQLMEQRYAKYPNAEPPEPARYTIGNTLGRYAYSLMGGFLLTLIMVVLARR